MIYPQVVRDYNGSGTTDVFKYATWNYSCLMQGCNTSVNHREWYENKGYCNKHAVELSKIW